MRKPDEEWLEAKIEQLRTLWAITAMSTAAIGRKMHISKSAVVGKAHRLNLPPRKSPILSGETSGIPPRVVAPRRVKGPTLPPLPTSDASSLHLVAALAAPAPPPPAQLERPDSESRFACRWPIGEPGTQHFEFCGEHIGTNRNYCAEHHAIAFIALSTLLREHASLATIEAYAAEHQVAVKPATGLSGLVVAVNNHRRAVGLTPFAMRQRMAA